MPTRPIIALALLLAACSGAAGCRFVLLQPNQPFQYVEEDRAPKGENATRAFPVELYRLVLAENGGVEDAASEAERVVTVLTPTDDLGEVPLSRADRLGAVLEGLGILDRAELWAEAAIVRQGTAVQERYIVICDIRELLVYGDLHHDLELRSGDVVFLPFENTPLQEAVFSRFGVVATVIEDVDDMSLYLGLVEGF